MIIDGHGFKQISWSHCYKTQSSCPFAHFGNHLQSHIALYADEIQETERESKRISGSLVQIHQK
jgi:hypothetical protein